MHAWGPEQKPDSSARDALGHQELWNLVERVCNSRQFHRSTRLRGLLRYLCRRAWDEGAEEIKEQEIGMALFERRANFDYSQDTLVRVQASQLRKRLERYFSEEGAAEPFLIEIPRGSYLPAVVRRGASDSGEPGEAEAGPDPPRRQWLVITLAGLCVALSAACFWLWQRPAQQAADDRKVHEFWNAFSANGRENYIVLADSAISAVQDALRHQIGLDDYVRRSYEAELDREQLPAESRALIRYLMARRYTSLADVFIVRQVAQARLLDPDKTTVVFARDHNVRAFQRSNNLLVGSQRAVPWVSLFDDKLDFHIYDRPSDFHLAQDAATSRKRVGNRRPKPGEPAVFETDTRRPEGSEGFSLIAYIPNLSRNGNTLILAGTEMSGTETAGMLLTTESWISALMNRLPRQANGTIPHFEALLKTRQVENATRSFEIVAIHIH